MPVQSNVLLTDDIIAMEALLLLKNNLVAARCVYRSYEREFGKVGDTIRLKLPFRVKSTEGRVLGKKPMVDSTIPFVINRQRNIGLEYSMKDKTLDIKQFAERYLSSGMSQLANVIDESILLTIKLAYHTSGTPGTRPGAYIDFANAAAKQNTYSVPLDGQRHCILNPFTCASVSNEVTKIFEQSMVKSTYKTGYKGDLATYQTYESQNLPTHTVGDHGGTPLMAAIGVAGAKTIATDGWDVSTTGLLLVGDVFTIAGVFGVNTQSYKTTGLLQEFVVTAEAESDAGGLSTLTFEPELNDGTATTTNPAGDTISLEAYQNITALPADGAAIVVQGVANTIYEQEYLFHKNAIALVMIDLELPKSAVVKSRASDPDTGLSLMLTQAYDIIEGTEITRLDAVWGAQMIDAHLALKLWGENIGTVTP